MNLSTVNIGTVQKMTSPNPFALLVTEFDGKVNAMAISWWTYVSNRPPMLVVSLSHRGFSGGQIEKSGKFTLCLPASELASAAFGCGTVSGRDADKFEQFNIKKKEVVEGYPPAVDPSGAVLCCSVVETTDASDHTIFIATIDHILADESLSVLRSYSGYKIVK